jgi:twitching motility two-component system response regulator PilH
MVLVYYNYRRVCRVFMHRTRGHFYLFYTLDFFPENLSTVQPHTSVYWARANWYHKTMNDEQTQQQKILLIEDDPFLSELVTMRFKKDGIALDHVENAEAGLEKIKEQTPRLILLDIVLPGMGGFEFLKKIKADAETAPIPVIIISNLGQKVEIEQGMELGASDYIIKATHDISDIIHKINTVLDAHKI